MASGATAKSFSATLTPSGNSLHWVVIEIPFDSVRVWGVRGQVRVKGTINDYPFQTSLFPTGDGRHFMIVNKRMQKGGDVRAGMTARFRMEPDTEKPADKTAPELERSLHQSRRLEKYYASLAPSMRNFMTRYVSEPKQAEARVRRAEQTAEHLMETMEAEQELPPLIRQVFARNPPAGEAWQHLTPAQRRMHLLGIFHYRSLDARVRRIEKTVAALLGERD